MIIFNNDIDSRMIWNFLSQVNLYKTMKETQREEGLFRKEKGTISKG